MGSKASSKWRAALNFSALSDADRADLLAGILKMSPNCPLSQIPAIASTLAVLSTKGTTLAANIGLVASTQQQLKANVAQLDLSRVAFDRELVALKSLIESAAPDPGAITAMGLTLLIAAKPSMSPPDPPAALVVKAGKAHGKARVSVQGTGDLGRFLAEMSQDPAGAGPWTLLPGTGKARKLSGYATGTKLWVRFAAVRFGMQSDWCTPVLVIIP